MSRAAIVSVLGITAVCLCGPASRGQSQPTGNRIIAGVVISEASGQPLEGAYVTLQDTNGFKQVAASVTDNQGRFSFPNFPDGKFALSASRRGYVQTTYEEHDGPFTAIVTGENQNTTGLVLSLPQLGAIFGTVAEDSGDPVPNARLMLFRQSHFVDLERVVRAGQTNADAMGNFEFSSLAPGTYFLCASGVPWYRPMNSNGRFSLANSAASQHSPLDVTYPLTCFPETADPSGAEPISLKAGDRIEANVTMHPVLAMHILFQTAIDDPRRGPSMPQLHQNVFGFREYIQASEFVQPRNENDPGPTTIEIADIPPGQYSLEVPGSNPSQDTAQFGTVQVSSNDLSLDASSLRPMASVSGKLTVAGGGALPSKCSIVLFSQPGEVGGSAFTDADGKFQIHSVLPGNYEVQINVDNAAWLVTQLRVNGAAIDGLELKVGSDPIDLTVVAARTAGTASITGFVTRNGKPASGVFLALVPANANASRSAWQPNQSDSDGSFIMQNVSPGQYKVVAIDQGWTLDWRDRSVITPYLANAAKVTVGANSKEVVLNSPVEAQAIGAQRTH